MITLEDTRRKLGPGVEFFCEGFQADAGDHIALWGPSGCGKSTMLNLISGLLLPDSGKIVVDGEEIQDRKRLSDRVRENSEMFIMQALSGGLSQAGGEA